MPEELNDEFLENMIFKGFTTDKTFLVLISNSFIPDYFNNVTIGKTFTFVKNHFEEFHNLPTKDVLLNAIDDDDLSELFDTIDEIDFNIESNYDYLVTESNKRLKDQAIRKAMQDSVDVIQGSGDLEIVRHNIEDALCKDLSINLGLNYFGDLAPRLERIWNTTEERIKTYYPTFDEYINGGFPPFTLSVLCAKIHGFKSNTMANWAARQVLHGHDVVLLTLEMSEDMFAQRFDSIYSMLDINRLYITANKRTLTDRLVAIKNTPGRGNLYIKQFPTGAASVRDFRIYLRELILRGIRPHIIYVDYINLMRSTLKINDGNMYLSVKAVAEELRALSFEFKAPVVSVSQLNREGSFVGFEELDFNYIAESHGVPATADFMSIIGVDETDIMYKSELRNKIVKNRLGGRVGDKIKWYYDSRTLKIYDEQEEQIWISDATITGDTRDFYSPPPQQEETNTRRRRR